MSFKPKYCCQCGDQIERVDWKWTDSRRFCKLCETEYRFQDWLPYLKGIGAVLTLFAIGYFFQKPEKPLNLTSSQSFVGNSNGSNAAVNQPTAAVFSNANAVQMTAQTFVGASPKTVSTTANAPDGKTQTAANAPIEASEKVYFCGAATKKGTPCSRRVKGGGRCWQHVGQPAMLAQEKLLVSQ